MSTYYSAVCFYSIILSFTILFLPSFSCSNQGGFSAGTSFEVESGRGRKILQRISNPTNLRLQFLTAVRFGNLFNVEQLDTRNPDLDLVNAKSPEGTPAIWSAAYRNKTEIVKYLIDNGADIDARNVNGTSAAYIAAQKGYLPILDLLIDAGTDLNLRSKWSSTIIGVATQQGHVDIVRRLVQEDISETMNAATDLEEQTPLWVAAHNGFNEICRLLVEHNASIHQTDRSGSTPLWAAAQEGHYAVVSDLLYKGANSSITNRNGSTALHVAAAFCHSRITVRLSQNFATALIMEDQDGLIPADLLCLNHSVNASALLWMEYHVVPSVAAIRLNKTEHMILWLTNQTARPLPVLANGQNLLHVATTFGNIQAAEYLLETYPDLAMEYDNEGNVPFLTIGSLPSVTEEENEELRLLFIERGLVISSDSSSDSSLSDGIIVLIVLLTVLFCIFLIGGIIWCKKCRGFHKSTALFDKWKGSRNPPVREHPDTCRDHICSFFDSNSTNTEKGGKKGGPSGEEPVANIADEDDEEPWKPFNYVHYLNTDNVDITGDVFNLTEYESLQLGEMKDPNGRNQTFQYVDEGTSRLQRPVELAELDPVTVSYREIDLGLRNNTMQGQSSTNTTESHPDKMMSWSTGPTKDNSVGSHSTTEQGHEEGQEDSGSDTFNPRMTYMTFEDLKDVTRFEEDLPKNTTT